eukprot:TRINITY_DN6225_c0_g1_i1.p1 TRINITY_DN6225_c0_g1~~TRINITY_DN6225_c0_g1_i1.p1  ORF type:complete len:448 (-),score=70.06 TRINITY_DN6225_c0_g1_i1:54-1328(-)
MFPITNLPNPALKRVLHHLTLKDKKNLRLVSLWFAEIVLYIDPSTRRWKILIDCDNYTTIHNILRCTREKNNVRLRLNLSFHGSMTKTEESKTFTKHLLTDWREDIVAIEIRITGNEDYLCQTKSTFTNLEQLSLKVQQTWDTESGEQATEIKRALIENHSKTLKKLEVHNLYKVEVERPLSKLNNLQLQNCDLVSVNNVLRRCGDALQGLEMFQCFGEKLDEDHNLKNLQHLLIESCDTLCSALIQRVSEQIVTLKIRSTDVYLYKARFPVLEFLWVENVSTEVAASLIGRCYRTIKYLFVRGIYASPETALKLPNLKDLIVDGRGPWCLELIKKNAASLEFLAILYPGRNLESITCNFSNLKVLLLPDCDKMECMADLKSRCPEGVELVVNRIRAGQMVKRRATNHYPYYRIAEDLIKRGYF